MFAQHIEYEEKAVVWNVSTTTDYINYWCIEKMVQLRTAAKNEFEKDSF